MAGRAGWVEFDVQTAGLATAARAAEVGKQHIITGISGSFSSTQSGALLQIKDGAAVIWQGYVYDQFDKEFSPGIPGTIGNAVSAELAAGAGDGAVAINGETF